MDWFNKLSRASEKEEMKKRKKKKSSSSEEDAAASSPPLQFALIKKSGGARQRKKYKSPDNFQKAAAASSSSFNSPIIDYSVRPIPPYKPKNEYTTILSKLPPTDTTKGKKKSINKKVLPLATKVEEEEEEILPLSHPPPPSSTSSYGDSQRNAFNDNLQLAPAAPSTSSILYNEIYTAPHDDTKKKKKKKSPQKRLTFSLEQAPPQSDQRELEENRVNFSKEVLEPLVIKIRKELQLQNSLMTTPPPTSPPLLTPLSSSSSSPSVSPAPNYEYENSESNYEKPSSNAKKKSKKKTALKKSPSLAPLSRSSSEPPSTSSAAAAPPSPSKFLHSGHHDLYQRYYQVDPAYEDYESVSSGMSSILSDDNELYDLSPPSARKEVFKRVSRGIWRKMCRSSGEDED